MYKKISKYKEQNTIFVSHQYILLNYLLHTILILNITIIIKEKLTGASTKTNFLRIKETKTLNAL